MYFAPRNCLKYLVLLVLALSLPACQPDDGVGIKPSEFTKAQREDLGDLIQSAIANNTRDFSILPNVPPFDIAYEHINRLYSQAHDALQKDSHSPSSDRWDPERPWKTHILLEDQKNAFILPGGHFYITSGLLKALETEHELYFIMAFELSLMNEKYLFNRLLNNFNTTILIDMISGSPSPNGATPNSIALALSEFQYDEEDLLETDEKTIELICETSIWDPTGLIPIYVSTLDELSPWIINRDYPGRISRLDQLKKQMGCGAILGNGAYEEKVTSNIP